MGEKQGQADPFVLGRFGGSRKTATDHAAISTGATTAAGKASGPRTSSSVPARSSHFEPLTQTLFLCGAGSSMTAVRRASTARSSATKGRASRRSLSDRLTRSLITSGLVCGITPSSIRQLSGQPIRVLAFDTPAGPAAAPLRKGFSSSSAPDRPTGEDSPANEGEGAS